MRKLFFLASIALMVVFLAGCVGPRTTSIEGAERDQVLAQAEPIADSLFQGMLDHDYAAFSRDFDPTMKKAMDETRFQTMMQTIDPLIGAYQSRQVASVERSGNFIAVIYTVKFELEDAVTWRVVLAPGDVMQVSGLWYDSPKLRAK